MMAVVFSTYGLSGSPWAPLGSSGILEAPLRPLLANLRSMLKVSRLGKVDGDCEGSLLGLSEKVAVGNEDGEYVGILEGVFDGESEGTLLGCSEGDCVGNEDGI